ncbi:hypothetical protein ACIQUM_31570 [Amycolatopsis azurea]|uniref:hypothetical protein n=1 Tax=Amycolatopsis azurea TaxID=36819 RepID=UPI00380589F0
MKSIICGTCSRALDTFSDASGDRYIHPSHFAADHEPAPVEAPDDWRGHCDFCFSDKPVAVLPTNDFIVPHMPDHLSRGDWSACGMCSMLIETGRWERLVKRAVRKSAEFHEIPVDVAMLVITTVMYEALRENIRGPLRPLAEKAGTDG